MLKKILLGITTLIVSYSFSTTFFNAKVYARTYMVTIGTGGIAGRYYPTGGAIAKMVNMKRKEYGIRVSVESTGGSVFNINAVMSGDIEFGMARSDSQYNAWKGFGEWKDKGRQSDLRAVFSIFPEAITLVASVDSGIRNIGDLRGKRISIGKLGSIQRQNSIDALTMVGIDWKRQIEEVNVRVSDAAALLQDRQIDAFFYTTSHPSGVIEEVTTGRPKVSIIDVASNTGGGTSCCKTTTACCKTFFAFLKEHPYYVKNIIPKDLYPGAANIEDVITFGPKVTFVTSTKVPDEIVYAITKEVFDNLAEFKNLHPVLSSLTKKNMLKGLTAPIHSGALKYFKESGLL